MAADHLASIDLGSNTFKLRIAQNDEKLKIVKDLEIPVFIGKDSYENKKISSEALSRAKRVIDQFNHELKKYEIKAFAGVATEAIRNASNGKEIISMFEEDIPFRIISGEEEAKLIYTGVLATGLLNDKVSLIIDIGGGSVEFIFANKDQIFELTSIPAGVSRAMETIRITDPPNEGSLNALDNFFNAKLSEISELCDKYNVQDLIGCAGSFDSWRALIQGTNSRSPYAELQQDDLEYWISKLNKMTISERLELSDLVDYRADTIIPAAALVAFLLKNHTFKRIYQCSYALPEALLLALKEN